MRQITSTLIVAAFAAIVGSASATPARSTEAHVSAANVDSAVRALGTARRESNGQPYSIDRERSGGASVWDIDVARPSGRSAELLVSADGRRVVRRSTTARTVDTDRARRASVGLATALRTAARRANGRLDGADVDRFRGRTVWSATFIRGGIETEVYVDAGTSRVVRVERDDD